MDGRDLIEYERRRQTTDEGWSIEHDDQHTNGELYDAGLHYLVHGVSELIAPGEGRRPIDPPWPFGEEWWKPQTPVRDLVRAGALFYAEIDRLKRLVSSPDWVEAPGVASREGVRAVTLSAMIDGIAACIDREEA